ncbi:MFS transporter [Halorubellus sp. JP-L1]|uniref:MFS transporter n=1 Tax=Halorubellus sp. JP-L1 TaxID=2715753 RepID=UPI001407C23B|nr:MFS transporter [Halorubellus sp. JP-L1]NHN40248.1 MFS transporter [Halorubellus sp. JP-L1]
MPRDPLRYVPHVLVASVGYVVFAYAALPDLLTARLGIGLSEFGLLMSAPLAAFVVVQRPASRWVGEHTSTRVLFAGGVAHVALAFTLDLSTSFPVVLALRGLWGFAGGLLLSVGATHISRLADGTSGTRQQGVYGGLLTFGGMLGFLFAPTLVERFGWLALHAPGAVVAIPGLAVCAHSLSDARTAPTGTVAAGGVVLHPVVLLAATCYVAVIGSYVTLSTFVTAYFDDLGVLASLNAIVLGAATTGRFVGGETAWRFALSDRRLVATSTGAAAVGFGALAVTGNATALVVLPFVVMLAVSIPFGAVYNLAAEATDAEGTALATVVAVGNVAAVALPPITGTIREATGSYAGAFLVLGTLNAVAAAATYYTMVRQI